MWDFVTVAPIRQGIVSRTTYSGKQYFGPILRNL